MTDFTVELWKNDQAQNIVEYAVTLAVILLVVVGTLHLIGSNSNTAFSNAASSIQELAGAVWFRMTNSSLVARCPEHEGKPKQTRAIRRPAFGARSLVMEVQGSVGPGSQNNLWCLIKSRNRNHTVNHRHGS